MLAADAPGGKPYGAAVDLFALGGVMYALLGAHVAFDPSADRSDDEVMARIACADWAFEAEVWQSVSEGAKDIIRQLLEPDPSKRLTADRLLTSQWTSGEGVSDTPLPPSHNEALKRFNGGRKVWRAAVDAAAVFFASPLAALHHAATPEDAQSASGGAPPASAPSAGSSKAPKTAATRNVSTGKKLLPAAVQAELRSAFSCFDLDGNGQIDLGELRHVLRSLGANEADASRILAAADKDGDGTVSFDEFAELVRPVYADSGAALRAAFDMFDADKSGYIDRQELSVMLRKLGFEWQGAHVFEAADTNQDGKVSFAEFLALFGKGVTKVQGTR